MTTKGYVRFPTERRSTNEGGMFVLAVVLDPALWRDRNTWMPCCGGYHQFFLEEEFIGDDLFDPSFGDLNELVDYQEQQARMEKCLARYFPRLDDTERPLMERYVSTHVLCIITLGATGWSGAEWVCTRNDLTPEGETLCTALEQLYDGCELRLLTFLDT